MKVGEKIAQRMQELNLNQVALAKRVGLTQQVISQYVRNKSKPGYNAIIGLSISLEVGPEWFFEDIEKRAATDETT